MNEDKLQELLDSIRDDMFARFLELKEDNERLNAKMRTIEEKLGIDDENITQVAEQEQNDKTENLDDDLHEEHKEEEPTNDDIDKQEIVDADIASEMSEEQEIVEEEEVETRPEVKLEKLPSSTFQGFCFRPIAGWENRY